MTSKSVNEDSFSGDGHPERPSSVPGSVPRSKNFAAEAIRGRGPPVPKADTGFFDFGCCFMILLHVLGCTYHDLLDDLIRSIPLVTIEKKRFAIGF